MARTLNFTEFPHDHEAALLMPCDCSVPFLVRAYATTGAEVLLGCPPPHQEGCSWHCLRGWAGFPGCLYSVSGLWAWTARYMRKLGHGRCKVNREPQESLLPLGKMVAGGRITLSTHKASKIIGKGKSPPTPFWYLIGGGPAEGRHMCYRGQNGGRGPCWTKEACQLSLGKEGIGQEVNPPGVCGSWEVNWAFWEHLVHPIPKTNINPGEGRGALLPTWWMHWPLHLQDFVALEGVWLMAAPVPHAISRKEPEAASSQEQAKLPGWPLSSHLWFPKDGNRNSGHCFLFWSGLGWLGFP